MHPPGIINLFAVVLDVQHAVVFAHFTLEQAAGGDQVAEFFVAVVDGGERGVVGNVLPEAAQVAPAVFLGGLFCGVAQQLHQGGVPAQFIARLLGVGFRAGGFIVGFGRLDQVLGINELGTGVYERQGRFLFAEAVHLEAVGEDAHGQGREIAVAGHQGEGVQLLGVEQVHGVDDHGGVGGVLALRVGELLDGLNGEGMQGFLPAFQVACFPIAVGASDVGGAVFGQLIKHPVNGLVTGVITIN